MDAAVTPAPSDTQNAQVELPVDIDTLAIDGTVPQKGDQVDLKVSGTITRVVNNTAYVKPTQINDAEMPAPPLQPNSDLDELDRAYQLSKQQQGSTPPGGY